MVFLSKGRPGHLVYLAVRMVRANIPFSRSEVEEKLGRVGIAVYYRTVLGAYSTR